MRENQTIDTETRQAILLGAEDLHRRMEAHRRLVSKVLTEGGEICHKEEGMGVTNERRLTEALWQTIEVLEGTRKAFKSRQLEALRKKLMTVLADGA